MRLAFDSVPLAIGLAAVAMGCGGGGRGSAPPAAVSVVSVTDLGTIPTNPRILGRDGGYSAVFQGVSVWLYGDTFVNKPNAGNFTLISDTWSSTADLTVGTGITGFTEPTDSTDDPTMILPYTPAEAAFNAAHNSNGGTEKPLGLRWALWPSSIVVDPVQNRALIFYMLISAASGDFNFQSVGSSVATWTSLASTPVRPNISPAVVPAHPDMMFTGAQPSFGATALISGGILYAYSGGVPNKGLDKGCRLGRVDPAQVQNLSAWTYYAGNGKWSPRVADAISVFNGNSILSVSWNAYLGLYIAVYSAPFSQSVMLRTSPKPEGPWSGEVKLFDAKPPASGTVYDAHEHAEYAANGGQTILITYSRSLSTPFTFEVRQVSVQLRGTTGG